MKVRLYSPTTLQLVLLPFVICVSSVIYAQGRRGESLDPKPTPAPSKRGGSKVPKPTVPTSSGPVSLAFNQPIKGSLDPKTSSKSPNGNWYEEYTLNAKSGDLIAFQLQAENLSLFLQVVDQDNTEVPLAKDFSSGDFKIDSRTQGLPADGEYRIRVHGTASGKNAIPYTLTVNRVGLVTAVYNERLEKIVLGFRESDPASIDETIAKLVELATDDNSKPGAYEYLGIIYLDHRRDLEKATFAMEQAIKTNGAAVIKISYDSQWRRLSKSKGGKFDWEDPRSGWLRIRPNQLVLTDLSNKALANLSGAQIKDLSKLVNNANSQVMIAADNARKPYFFLPGSRDQAQTDLVIRLIQIYVMRGLN